MSRLPFLLLVLSAVGCSSEPAAPAVSVPFTPQFTVGSGVTRTDLGQSTFDVKKVKRITDKWHVELKAKDGLDIAVRTFSYEPGSFTGWHRHPGPVFIQVVKGTVTFYEANDPTCTPIVVDSGEAYLDLGEDGHIWAIDHGLCFHASPKLRTVIWEFGGEAVPDELMSSVARFAVAPPVASFAGLLDDEELVGSLEQVVDRRAHRALGDPDEELGADVVLGADVERGEAALVVGRERDELEDALDVSLLEAGFGEPVSSLGADEALRAGAGVDSGRLDSDDAA